MIGKHLKVFYRARPKQKVGDNPSVNESDIQVPLVFIRIYEYFLREPSRLEYKDVFRKLDKAALV